MLLSKVHNSVITLFEFNINVNCRRISSRLLFIINKPRTRLKSSKLYDNTMLFGDTRFHKLYDNTMLFGAARFYKLFSLGIE